MMYLYLHMYKFTQLNGQFQTYWFADANDRDGGHVCKINNITQANILLWQKLCQAN